MTNTDPTFDPAFAATLSTLLALHGPTLLDRPPALQAELQMRHPAARREIAVLMQALAAHVPHRIAADAGALHDAALAAQLAEDTALAESATRWAVATWRQALAGPVQDPRPAGGAVTAPAWSPGAAPTAAPAVAGVAMPSFGRVLPAAGVAAGSAPARPRPVKALVAGGAVALVAVAAGAAWMLQPRLEITGVRAAQAVIVGDGRPQATVVSFNARRTEPRSVEVRFVRGDGQWTPTTWSAGVEAAGRTAGEVTAGSLRTRVSTPTRSTFSYVLVDAQGRRSEPFEQTFDIVPPVVLNTARVTGPVRPGRAATVQLAWARGAGDVVQVEQRVVDSTVAWAATESTRDVRWGGPSGTGEVQVDLPAQAGRSTLEFRLVDSLGARSEPVRVSLAASAAPIVAGPAVVVSVVQLAGVPTGVGAVGGAVVGAGLGSRIGGGSGQTVATVLGALGGAYAGQQVQQRVGGRWETAVRFDDGNVRRIAHGEAPRWSPGDRVLVSGSAISR